MVLWSLGLGPGGIDAKWPPLCLCTLTSDRLKINHNCESDIRKADSVDPQLKATIPYFPTFRSPQASV